MKLNRQMYCRILDSFCGIFLFQQPRRAEEEVQVDELVFTTDNKKMKARKKESENTEEEFSEKGKITEEDETKEEDGFYKKQAAVEDAEASEWSVEEPVTKIQTLLKGLDIEIEEQKEVDITEEGGTLQDAHMVTNEIEAIVVDELQAALKDLDSEKQIGVPAAEEIQTLLEDSCTTSTETEEAAVEKQVELNPAQEMQRGSKETEELSNIIEEIFSEEHAQMHVLSEVSTAEDSNAEQESGDVVEEIPSEEADNVDNQMRDIIPAEIEREAVKDLTAGFAKESLVSEESEEV